jgi:hypothetical protein
MIVVPLALYFTNQGPAPVSVPTTIASPSPSSTASSASTAR